MKLNKKLTSILVTGAMIASIGGTTAMTSFAEEPANPTEGKTITISKQLNIAQGLSAPKTDFDFTFTKDTEDGNAPTAAMPDLSGKVAYDGEKDADGDGYVMKNVVVDPSAVTWTHAGEYVYTVKEANEAETGITYDETSEYTVTIRVKNDGNGGFAIADIVVKDKDGNKVDVDNPQYPDGDTDRTDDPESGMKFTNKYVKVADGTPTDLDEDDFPEGVDPADETPEAASFVITKDVVGDFGDKTKQFKFAVTFDTTKTGIDDPTIKCYKVDAAGNVTVANPADFTLAHGEKLIVEGAPVGTTYDVTENLANADNAAAKYAAAIVVTEDGTANDDKAVEYAAENAGKDGKVEKALVTEGENGAAYTNKNAVEDEDTTPTGILMQNAPYILVATLAAGGLVIYLAKRREEEEEA